MQAESEQPLIFTAVSRHRVRGPGLRARTPIRCVTAEVTDARTVFVCYAFAHEIFKYIIILSLKGAVNTLEAMCK